MSNYDTPLEYYCAVAKQRGIKPHNEAENRRLMLLYKDSRDNDALESLILGNAFLMRKVFSRYKTVSDAMRDDLADAIFDGFMKGIESWSEESRVPFSQRVFMYMRAEASHKIFRSSKLTEKYFDVSSLDAPFDEDSDGERNSLIHYISTTENIEQELIQAETYNWLNNFIADTLKARERFVVEMCSGITSKGKVSYKEMAEQLGVSRQRVEQIYSRAIRKLQVAYMREKKKVLSGRSETPTGGHPIQERLF